MVVPILQGGLCNQLFQIANAYAYAKRTGNQYGINYSWSTCSNQGSTAIKYKNTLYKNIPEVNARLEDFTMKYNETQFRYVPVPRFNVPNILLEGYFQSDKYFDDCLEDIKKLFVFPSEVIDKVESFIKQIDKPIFGVHIRRGDYIKFKDFHSLQEPSYYINAGKIITGEHQIVICTDDWDSVNKEMNFKGAIKSPFSNDLEDLYLLSRCHSLILCNSSFSWWASFLTQEKKLIVAPKNWFASYGPQDFQDIYRSGWFLI